MSNLDHRIGSVEVQLSDVHGADLANTAVSVRMIRHGFPFGAALSHGMLSQSGFSEFITERFNWAVFANESKWYANEAQQGVETYDKADALLDWCDSNRFPSRGHCVFWEPEKWQPKWVVGLSEQELKASVERRLEHCVSHFAGRFHHWDVNNEMLHGSFYRDRLGEEIWPWMFQRVRDLDPEVKLYVNDFNVLSVDQDFSAVQTSEYVSQTRRLMEMGAPVDGVGIQGHVWYEDVLSNPGVIRERLDEVATLGLPIWITEFDVADDDQTKNADVLELVYRTCFEHPSVDGIVTWMPWEGDSWRGPNMGLADLNWIPKPPCVRLDSLLEEWTTEYETATNSNGKFTLVGFKGEYEVVAAGRTFKFTLE